MENSPHVVKVGENEGLVDIKATGNNVLGILNGKAVCLLHCQVLPEELLIVRQLHYQRHIKDILQVPSGGSRQMGVAW